MARTKALAIDPSVEFEGYDITRFNLKINAKELEIDGALHYGDYVTAIVRGRVGKIVFEPAADGTLARVHPVALASVKVTQTSRTVDPDQAELFGASAPEPKGDDEDGGA